MRDYRFDLQAYAQHRRSIDENFDRRVTLCKEPIQQLCRRFRILEKTILSIGAGYAFEESWMADASNVLTMVDLLDTIGECCDAVTGSGDRFVVCDADEFVQTCTETFDVLYISSFAPDELRREDLQAQFIKVRSQEDAYNYVTWRAGTVPYHPIVERALPLVKPGGLVILQHYRGGIDVTRNVHYFVDVARQFGSYGVRLVEAHHFRESPQNLLLVASKRSDRELRKLQRHLTTMPKITTFHGRYGDQGSQLYRDIVQVDPLIFQVKPQAVWKRLLRPILDRFRPELRRNYP